VCPYCWIDFREQLDALTAVAESELAVGFEIEYRPFQLISKHCLCESKTVDRRTFYVTQLSAEKVAAMDKAIGNWVEEKGVKL
jgi:predicted DsbA family dithiol-disulfide isomerase